MKRLPRFVHLGAQSKKDRLAAGFQQWNASGRLTPPTAELLAGMFYTRFRSRMFGAMPLSKVEDDLTNFRTLLHTTKALAPWCIEAMFAIKGFTNLRSESFCNDRVMGAFNIRSYAVKLRKRSVAGEQAEFVTDQIRYGVIRV